MPVNVAEAIKELIADILGNRQTALQFIGDPNGELASRGITEGDLSNVDVNGLAREACGAPGIPSNVQSAVQSATSGGPGVHPPAHSVEQVAQQITQVTEIAYQGDTFVTNHIINNDNRTDIDVEGDFDGDIDIDNENTNASDGGVANSGDNVNQTAATGDRANAIGGNNTGQVNSGDGAIQAGGSVLGANTGTNSGVVAGGPVTDTVVGTGNQTANIDGPVSGEPVLLFGGGEVNQANHNSVTDGAVSAGGNANNASNNDASQGGSVAAGGNSQGNFTNEDNDDNSTTIGDINLHDFGNTNSYNDADGHDYQPLYHADVMPADSTPDPDPDPADASTT